MTRGLYWEVCRLLNEVNSNSNGINANKYYLLNIYNNKFDEFINDLLNTDYDRFYIFKKRMLLESDFIKISNNSQFRKFISEYFNDPNMEIDFLYLYEKMFSINNKNYTEEYKDKLLDFININKDKDDLGYMIVTPTRYTDYEYYCKKINDYFLSNDKNHFFVWSEYNTYEEEKENIRNQEFRLRGKIPSEIYEPIWISRDYGDGFGFDILSFDTDKFKEKLIEVKSGSYDSFDLTKNELKTAYDSKKFNYDYYIRKFTHIFPDYVGYRDYYFDKEKDMFVVVDTKEECPICPYFAGEKEVKASLGNYAKTYRYVKNFFY